MRYRIVYQQEPLITTYRYCKYMSQVGAILRVWVPDISKDAKHRIEVKATDGKYYSIVQKGVDTALCFYHYLRRKGYKHTSAVIGVLMYYSPNKEDLYRRLERRHRYLEAQVVISCACCGKGNVKVVPCSGCGELICQDCTPPFGAHVCEPE